MLRKYCTQYATKFGKLSSGQITLPVSWEICMQVKKQQLELDMELQTDSKSEKEYIKAVLSSPCLFNLYSEYIMRNAGLEEAQAGIKIARRSINNLRYEIDTTLIAESKQRPSWWKWKRRVKNLAYRSTFRKLRSWHPVPSLHGK